MDTVLVEDQGQVRLITLNRPEMRNAIDLDLRVALGDALEAAMADGTVRVVVLTGSGSLFCSGGDVSTMRRMGAAEAEHRTALAQRVVRAILTGPKPVIAAVEGGAYGAGLSLAAACDRVVAADDALFSIAFQRVGLAGDMGIHATLPQRIGRARARQLLLLPHELTAAEALDWGLVDATVTPGTALEAALADAARLAAGPARAYAVTKRLLGHTDVAMADLLDLEAAEQVRLFDSADFGEGVAAFHEKRRPLFAEPPGVTA